MIIIDFIYSDFILNKLLLLIYKIYKMSLDSVKTVVDITTLAIDPNIPDWCTDPTTKPENKKTCKDTALECTLCTLAAG